MGSVMKCGLTVRMPMPALLTSTSMPPRSARRLGHVVDVTVVAMVSQQDGSPEASYDPMRQFAELAGDVRDPYPMLAGIRADSPVLRVDFGPRPGPTSRLDPK